MMSRVLKNKHNTVIIWTFAIKVDHIGTYLQFIHSLENKGKKLIFHLSAADMEKLTNNVLFNNLSERFVDRGMVEFRQMGN